MEQLTDSKSGTYEGTREEIAELAPKFTGHRVRVQILPEDLPSPFISHGPTGRYAARMRKILSDLPPATPEEMREADEEALELMRNLNENRRREGAEPLYLDV